MYRKACTLNCTRYLRWNIRSFIIILFLCFHLLSVLLQPLFLAFSLFHSEAVEISSKWSIKYSWVLWFLDSIMTIYFNYKHVDCGEEKKKYMIPIQCHSANNQYIGSIYSIYSYSHYLKENVVVQANFIDWWCTLILCAAIDRLRRFMAHTISTLLTTVAIKSNE